MVPDPSPHDVPLPDVADTSVYTTAGNYVGRAVDWVLDFDDDRVTHLLVEDVNADRIPLPDGVKGLRVPYRYVGGAADVVVLNLPVELKADDEPDAQSPRA